MKLRYITCSDPREDLKPSDVIDLLKTSPLAEIGVQIHKSVAKWGKQRALWFDTLLKQSANLKTPVNIAMHVNYEWCDEMCSGNIPSEIAYFMSLKNKHTNAPLISRIQLNIGDATYQFDAHKLFKLISVLRDYEFILPFNPHVISEIKQLKTTGAKFNLLFDGSYGAGISPEKWQKPVFNDVQFGYAGGISPKNVEENLNKISNILPQDYETWIDAEGQLRGNKWVFNLNLARDYLNRAIKWNNTHTK